LIATADNKSVLIKRWGRKDAFGDLKFELYNDVGSGEIALEKILRDKQRNGYMPNTSDSKTAHDLAELIKIVGRPTWAKMNPATLKHIDPSLNTSGVREADPVRFYESGEFADPAPRTFEITPEMIEAEKL